MLSKIFRFLLGMLLMLVVSALVAFNALLVWVATGPRSLSVVAPYIEDALSSTDGSYDVKIGKVLLIWSGWKNPIDIRLKDVTIFTAEDYAFAEFSEIALGVDLLYLPSGRIIPTSLAISAPFMNIVQNDDRSFGFSFEQDNSVKEIVLDKEAAPVVPFSVLLAPFLSQSKESNFRRLHTIIIRDAGLHVSNSKKKVFFDAKNFNLVLNRNRQGEIRINSSTIIDYNNDDDINTTDYSFSVRTELSLKPNKKIVDGVVEFSELMPDVLAGLFVDNSDIKSFAVPVSGKINLSFDMDDGMKYLDFDINGGKGNITSSRLPAPLSITTLQFRGSVADNFASVNVESLDVNMEDMKFAANAKVNLFDTASDSSATPEISANVVLENVLSNKIKNFWPTGLSPMTREWVTKSISDGKISKAHLVLNIKKGDLSKPFLPKEAVDANINITGVKILYLPEHPPATNVKGKIHIDGLGLVADIKSADYLKTTKLSKGHVLIEDLNADNPYIKVDLNVDAPAKDIVHFLGLPRLKHAKNLALREDSVSGRVKGKVKVGFNFFAPKGMKAEDAIVFDVKAKVSRVSQDGFLHKFDIVGGEGVVHVDNDGVKFVGIGEVNGAKVSKSDVKYLFKPKKGINTFMEFSAVAGMDDIKRFGYPEFSFIKGRIGVDAKVKLGKNIEQNEAMLNLVDSEITLSDIGWKKPRGKSASISLVTEKKEGKLEILSFNLRGKKISAKGSATLSDNFSSISSVRLNKFIFGNTNISELKYANKSSGMQIEVKARRVDLTIMDKNSSGFSFKNFPAVKLKANIGAVILGKDRVLSGFSGRLRCDKNICHYVNLQGKTGADKDFAIKILKNAKKQRFVSINSDDAGSFLRVFGVFNGMNGGKLSLTGNYNRKSNSTLTGIIKITEHTVKDAPLLGRILSLASLTGFFDALAGNGIRFDELSIPFTLHNDVATLKKGKVFGSAIGLTVDGTVAFPDKFMDLQGTLAPSYTLNSVLGKIPLFGEMLTGGEGKGVFAARYSIKGVEKTADVGVNPLSILTPGFLRGMFDIFDGDDDDKRK